MSDPDLALAAVDGGTGALPPLPDLLARIAEATSLGVALALARELGGTRVCLPARPVRDTHPLVRAVGATAAQAIIDAIGAGTVTIPMGPMRGAAGRRQRAAQMLAAGASARQVALATDLSERAVYRLRAAGLETMPLLPGLDGDSDAGQD